MTYDTPPACVSPSQGFMSTNGMVTDSQGYITRFCSKPRTYNIDGVAVLLSPENLPRRIRYRALGEKGLGKSIPTAQCAQFYHNDYGVLRCSEIIESESEQ